MRGVKHILTEKQVEWLKQHYKHTKNADCAKKLGISPTSVYLLAKKYGLKKSTQFMHKCQKAIAATAKESHLRNGTYPPKGQPIPGWERGALKPGQSMKERMGARRWKKAVAKRTESWKKTYRLEYGRMLFGIPRRTKLRVVRQPDQKVKDRWYLKQRGYILDEINLIAYWTEDTRRATRLEAAPRRYYKFEKHPSL